MDIQIQLFSANKNKDIEEGIKFEKTPAPPQQPTTTSNKQTNEIEKFVDVDKVQKVIKQMQGNALAKKTLAAMKTQRMKFKYVCDIKDETKIDQRHLTDDNILKFLASVWIGVKIVGNIKDIQKKTTKESKSAIESAMKFINHMLSEDEMQRISRKTPHLYKPILNFFQGLRNQDVWIDYETCGAGSLTEEEVKAISNYNIFKYGKLDLEALHYKCISSLLIHQ